MNDRNEILKILRKYAKKIRLMYPMYVKSIPPDIIENTIDAFHLGLDAFEIIGLFDTTIMKTGEKGWLFTRNGVYYRSILGGITAFRYDNVKSIDYLKPNKKKEPDKGLYVRLKDGSTVVIDYTEINTKWFIEYIKHVVRYQNMTPQEWEEFVKNEELRKQREKEKRIKRKLKNEEEAKQLKIKEEKELQDSKIMIDNIKGVDTIEKYKLKSLLDNIYKI